MTCTFVMYAIAAVFLFVGVYWFVFFRRKSLSHRQTMTPLTTRTETHSAATTSAKDFDGQVAIITGGGTGLGRAIALNLAGRGAKVVIASRDKTHLEAVSSEIAAC